MGLRWFPTRPDDDDDDDVNSYKLQTRVSKNLYHMLAYREAEVQKNINNDKE
jgi:hypothetical protein